MICWLHSGEYDKEYDALYRLVMLLIGLFVIIISKLFSEVTTELFPDLNLRKTSCATGSLAPFLFLSGL